MYFKVYTEFNHYRKEERNYLFDLLRPFTREDSISNEELRIIYGSFIDKYEFVGNINNADFVVLPMAWEFYYLNKKRELANRLIDEALSSGKSVFTKTCGDFGVTPLNNEVIVLRSNGYQSRRLLNQHALPAFIECPMKKIFNLGGIHIRDKTERPVIGFCGQAVSSCGKNLFNVTRTMYRNIKYYAGLSIYEPHALYPSTKLRQNVLEAIEKDSRLVANFIKRDKYRAGAKDTRTLEDTTIEFYTNLLESDYGVCIRGGGNFSVRLYETLSMGRIPVFINTNCILPYDKIIDWKQYVVWIEDKEINKMPDKIIEFHSSITNEQFREMQVKCRELWEEYLTINGFMKHLPELAGIGTK